MADFKVQNQGAAQATYQLNDSSHALKSITQSAENINESASKAAQLILNQRSNLQVIWDFIKSLFGTGTTETEVSQLFYDISNNGSLESFGALHEKLRPDVRHLLKLDCNKSANTWTYSIKFGDTTIHQSTARSVGDGSEFATFDDTSMLSKVSDALGQRKEKLNVDAELKDLMSELKGLDTLSKYEKISNFVLSKTAREDCFNYPVELYRLPTKNGDPATFQLTVDGRSVHEQSCHSINEQVAATKSQINIFTQNILNATEDLRSLENFRAANIECMSDDKAMRNKIVEHLDNPICRPENLVYIKDQNDAPVFKALFRDESGQELEFEFSTRLATNFEFRDDRLKEALLKSDYNDLRDLTAQGHNTSRDALLIYAMTPLRADIEKAISQLSTTTASISNSNLRAAQDKLAGAEIAEKKTSSALKSATRRVRHYTNNSKTPPKDLMRQVKAETHFYEKAKDLTKEARTNFERLNMNINELQELNEKTLDAIKSIKIKNATIGEVLYGEAHTAETNAPITQSSAQTITNNEMIRV